MTPLHFGFSAGAFRIIQGDTEIVIPFDMLPALLLEIAKTLQERRQPANISHSHSQASESAK